MDNPVDPMQKAQSPIAPLESQSRQDRNILDVARGGGVVFIGTVATRGLSYIYSLVLIWAMGPDSFGTFTLALAVVTFIGLVSTIGLPQGILRFGAIEASQDGENGLHRTTVSALRISVPTSLVFAGLVFWIAPSLATGVFQKTELIPVIRLLSLSIPFMSLQSTLLAATRALKIMKYTTIVGVVQPLLALFLAIPFISLGGGVESAVLAYVLSYIVGAGMSVVYYLRLIPRENRDSGPFSLGRMMRFSVPLSLTEWMHFANERTEIFFLGLLPRAVDISIYKIAWSLAGLETMLRLSLEYILAPFSSDLSHRRELTQLGRLYKATTKWGFALALMITLIYVLYAGTILRFFDPELAAGTGVLIALSFAQLFNEFTGPCNTILIMSGRSDLSLVNTIVIFVVGVSLDWLLIPRYGLTGAAIAGSVGVVVVNVMRVLEVWFTLKIHPFKLNFLKPITAGLIGAGVVLLARQLGWVGNLFMDAIAILFFCAIYLALIFLFKLDPDDLVVIHALRQKLITMKCSKRGNAAAKSIHQPQDIP